MLQLNFSGHSIELTQSEADALQSVLAKLMAANAQQEEAAAAAPARAKYARKRKMTQDEIIEMYTWKLIPYLRGKRETKRPTK